MLDKCGNFLSLFTRNHIFHHFFSSDLDFFSNKVVFFYINLGLSLFIYFFSIFSYYLLSTCYGHVLSPTCYDIFYWQLVAMCSCVVDG